MSAVQNAEAHIADAFRPERKAQDAVLLAGYRIKELVQAGRYSFPEACRLLGVEKGQVASAFAWVGDDNYRMNRVHKCEVHDMHTRDYFLLGWFNDEESCLEDNVIQFPGRAA